MVGRKEGTEGEEGKEGRREGGRGGKGEEGGEGRNGGAGGAESKRTDTGVVGKGWAWGEFLIFVISPLSGKGGGKAPRTLWIEMD